MLSVLANHHGRAGCQVITLCFLAIKAFILTTHSAADMTSIQPDLADKGKRVIAYLIDIVPILCLVFGVFYLFFGFDQTIANYLNRGNDIAPRIAFLKQRNWIRDSSFLCWVVYCIFMEASSRQGTFGKSIMGIKVVNASRERLTLRESVGRNMSKLLSYGIVGLGFIWILFDKNKQGWHDKLNHTYVIKNDNRV